MLVGYFSHNFSRFYIIFNKAAENHYRVQFAPNFNPHVCGYRYEVLGTKKKKGNRHNFVGSRPYGATNKKRPNRSLRTRLITTKETSLIN